MAKSPRSTKRAQTATKAPALATPPPAPAPKPTAPAARPAAPARAPEPLHPFVALRRLVDELDRVFAGTSLLPRLPRLEVPWGRHEAAWMPSVEVSERGGAIVVRADLPGLTKDDVRVEVRDDAVCIHGERRQEKQEKQKGVLRTERSYGSFYREIGLPEGADVEHATASFKHGVLEVRVPAPPAPAKGRRIAIED